MKNYILDGRYKDLLQYHGINDEEVLRKAQLPTDALNHRTPTMTEEGYYRFMTAIGELSEDDALPIKLSAPCCSSRLLSIANEPLPVIGRINPSGTTSEGIPNH